MSRKNWETSKIIERLINNKTKGTYWDNVHELHNRASLDIFQICEKFIHSNSIQKQIIGVDVLAQLGFERPFKKQTIPLLFTLLGKTKSVELIEAILNALSFQDFKPNPEQYLQLEALSSHKSHTIRHALSDMVSGINHKRAINILIELSKDKHSQVRDWATFGLGSQISTNNKAIRDALMDRIHDQHESTRFEAISGLAQRKHAPIFDIILKELQQEEFSTLLFDSIDHLANPKLLPELKKLYRKSILDKNIKSSWIDRLKDSITLLTK